MFCVLALCAGEDDDFWTGLANGVLRPCFSFVFADSGTLAGTGFCAAREAHKDATVVTFPPLPPLADRTSYFTSFGGGLSERPVNRFKTGFGTAGLSTGGLGSADL